MAESDQDDGVSGESDASLEDKLFDDMDDISDAAGRALTALNGGDLGSVEHSLERIKQTAESWGDPGQHESNVDNSDDDETPDMDDLIL
jgi:hypothetical protein